MKKHSEGEKLNQKLLFYQCFLKQFAQIRRGNSFGHSRVSYLLLVLILASDTIFHDNTLCLHKKMTFIVNNSFSVCEESEKQMVMGRK